MKKLVFIGLCAGFVAPIFGQMGQSISKDVRSYVEQKKIEGFEEKTAPKSVTKIDESKGIASIEPKKSHSIGGQRVDEANSTIFKAFRQHPEWKKVALVADCTGSMYPYIGQVVAWHQSNLKKELLLDITLFNDGDDNRRKAYPAKQIGQVGGIYHANPSNLDVFLDVLAKAIDGGDGDDAEENDLEAVLAAQARHPKADYIVLIADNSPVRDMALLSKVKKPVHVVLCNSGWVEDYVRIAYETGGSITTLSDQLDFKDKKHIDKSNIQLGGMKYSLK